jgi:hypothetical protein
MKRLRVTIAAAAALLCTLLAPRAYAEAQAMRLGREARPMTAARASSLPSLSLPRLVPAAPVPRVAELDARQRTLPAAAEVQSQVQASDTQALAEMLQRFGSLQFLSATLIAPRTEVVSMTEGQPVTQVTPSLRISPTFGARQWGIAAVATF